MGAEQETVEAALSLKRKRRRKGHQASGKSDAALRAEAVEWAADMEMGYYVDQSGKQWEPRAFVIAEVLRRCGYQGVHITEGGQRPVWWPGTSEMRRMVAMKVLLRQVQRTAVETDVPWLDAALATSAEELLRRLYIEPTKVASRELVDLITKLSRMKLDRRKQDDDTRKLPKGSVVFEEIRRTILELPESEQSRAFADYQKTIERAQRLAIPAQAS